MNTFKLELPLASDPRDFDFSGLLGLVPLSQSKITDESTILNCDNSRWSICEGYLSNEGTHHDRGHIESAPFQHGLSRDMVNTIHDALLMWCAATNERDRDGWYRRQAADLVATPGFPEISAWFRTYGGSYPGSRGYAAVINNALIFL